MNGTIPEGATEPITVKFANNPSNNAKAIPPLAAYLAPQAARRAFGGALHPAGRFRYSFFIGLSKIAKNSQKPPNPVVFDTFWLFYTNRQILVANYRDGFGPASLLRPSAPTRPSPSSQTVSENVEIRHEQ